MNAASAGEPRFTGKMATWFDYLKLSRHKFRLVLVLTILLGFAAYVAAQLSPLMDRTPYTERALSLPDIPKMEELAKETGRSSHLETPITTLVFSSLSITTYGPIGDKKEYSVSKQASLSVRYDLLIILTGGLAISVVLLWFLFSPAQMAVAHSASVRSSGAGTLVQDIELGNTAVEILKSDAMFAKARVDNLFARSTVMLVAGIILAFSGIGLFYFSLPEIGLLTSKIDTPGSTNHIDWTTYLTMSLRPAAALIFIEAIAWFLLRQYRALIGDFKTFHHLATKRINHLVAFRTLQDKMDTQTSLILIGALFATAAQEFELLTSSKSTAGGDNEAQAEPENPISSFMSAFFRRERKVN